MSESFEKSSLRAQIEKLRTAAQFIQGEDTNPTLYTSLIMLTQLPFEEKSGVVSCTKSLLEMVCDIQEIPDDDV